MASYSFDHIRDTYGEEAYSIRDRAEEPLSIMLHGTMNEGHYNRWFKDASREGWYISPNTAVIVSRWPFTWDAERRRMQAPLNSMYVYTADALETLQTCDCCNSLSFAPLTSCYDAESGEYTQLCSQCRRTGNYYNRCECGRYIRNLDPIRVHTHLSGDQLITPCGECDERIGRYLEHLSRCSHHGYYDAGEGENVFGEVNACPECTRERLAQSGEYVRSYHEHPAYVYDDEANRRTHTHFGIEYEYRLLEGECYAEEMAQAAHVLTEGKTYAQHDCTVDVEICTQPCTIETHREIARTMERLADYYEAEADSDDAGMHIHIDRDRLGDSEREQNLNAYKIMLLFDRFYPKFDFLAKRYNHEYARRGRLLREMLNMGICMPPENLTDDERLEAKHYANAERYQAVNVQPRYTVEIRLPSQRCSATFTVRWLEMLESIIRYIEANDCETCERVRWDDFAAEIFAADGLQAFGREVI